MMERIATDYLGWAATAVFVGSYFCTSTRALRALQMAGALMWVVYGLLIGASPVIAANVLVFGAAAWTMTGATRQPRSSRPTVTPRIEDAAFDLEP
jgi:choline dehydrogenase-like flavoprotein